MSIPITIKNSRSPRAGAVVGCLLIIWTLFLAFVPPFAAALALYLAVPTILAGTASYWAYVGIAFVGLWLALVARGKQTK